MPTVFITGANRGLGLEFARQFAVDGWRVLATCRAPERAADLARLAARQSEITVHGLDVADHRAIDALAHRLSDVSVDLLLSNAGISGDSGDSGDRGLGHLDYGEWTRTFQINTMAAARLAESFGDHLARSERRLMVALTSLMGSMGDNSSGGSYLYRSSKAALNAVMKSLSIDLRPRGIGVLILHPGWVRTDMGGPDGLITPQQSVAGMRAIIDRYTPADSGRFLNYDGSALPW
ncbi:MAG: short-chain dehydrogenase [Chromatiales bacterium 21-64-14]|nr:MAG: short-chain dehydrogenase [Chromatiales bacterium 21-64-14]HQU15824.1 SDR family oxidoreductase [Gammaproteobacteria bacterium]